MYCSRACRQNAYDSYHRTECKLIPYLMSAENSLRREVWLPLRIFLTGTKQGLGLEELLLKSDILDIFISGKKKLANTQNPTNDYTAVLHTLWSGGRDNHASISQSSQHFENFSYLFQLLERVHFFDEAVKNLKMSSEDEMDVRSSCGILLLHHIEVAKFSNDVTVHLMKSTPTQVTQIEDQCVASSFGLLQCFMNHSCDCNSSQIFNRREVLTFSLRPIKAGDQIFTTYGMPYGEYPRHLRSEYLAGRYGFECKCTACLNDWPTGVELAEREPKFKTKAKDVREQFENYYAWVRNLIYPLEGVYMYDYNKDGDLQKMLKCIRFVRQNVEEPSSLIFMSEVIMGTFMGMKGNCYIKGVQNYTIPPSLD